MTSVSFGDKPSAKIKEKEYPQAANIELNKTYVDGIVNSVKDWDKANNLVRQANHILSYDGFVMKWWTVSGGDESPNEKSDQVIRSGETSRVITWGQNLLRDIEKVEQKVLELRWNQCNDDFHFTVKVTFTSGRRKVHTGPNLSLYQTPKCIPKIPSERMILSQIN